MSVTNISAISQITMMYSNNNGGSIIFELTKDVTPNDPRVLEAVVIAPKKHVYNIVNRTVPMTVTLVFNEISEDARDILSEAFETQDDTGVLTALMPKSGKMRVWTNAVPSKNEIYNQSFPESIVSKEVQIIFTCAPPEDRSF